MIENELQTLSEQAAFENTTYQKEFLSLGIFFII